MLYCFSSHYQYIIKQIKKAKSLLLHRSRDHTTSLGGPALKKKINVSVRTSQPPKLGQGGRVVQAKMCIFIQWRTLGTFCANRNSAGASTTSLWVKIGSHFGPGQRERVVEAKMRIFNQCRAPWARSEPTKTVQKQARRLSLSGPPIVDQNRVAHQAVWWARRCTSTGCPALKNRSSFWPALPSSPPVGP